MAVKKRGKGRWRKIAKKKQRAVDLARPMAERVKRAEGFIAFLRDETERQLKRLGHLKRLRRKWPTKPGRR